ncbi:MAG: hypothetical protein H7301_06610, partial [Cryobacterium sp.]|nr:hypothetical protein [Oligoflexia bacterium]
MPYFLAPPIRKKDPALWGEGSPYSSEVIYDICSGNPVDPPTHYESHQLKPHSVCHFDAPGHIHADGLKIDGLYEKDPTLFYGA